MKCKKNIAEASSLFQGSVLKVTTPVFLKLVPDEEDVEEVAVESEELELAEEEIEISDPDLDILLEEEEETTAEVQLEMEDSDLEQSALDQLNDDLSEIEAFSEEDSGEDEVKLDFGTLDEAEVEGAFAEEEPEVTMSLEVPDELADLSDLSPPPKAPVEEKPVADDDIDFDFGDLGDEFGEEAAAAATAIPETKKPKEQKLSLDMDEDLDFDLDLGGLSIHDDDK
ncbi:hypothetical protein ACFL0S_11710 [Thermodesulfobacteriota bacterium]